MTMWSYELCVTVCTALICTTPVMCHSALYPLHVHPLYSTYIYSSYTYLSLRSHLTPMHSTCHPNAAKSTTNEPATSLHQSQSAPQPCMFMNYVIAGVCVGTCEWQPYSVSIQPIHTRLCAQLAQLTGCSIMNSDTSHAQLMLYYANWCWSTKLV